MSVLKASIGLLNPKSPTNVGGVLRAAGCYNAKQVFLLVAVIYALISFTPIPKMCLSIFHLRKLKA